MTTTIAGRQDAAFDLAPALMRAYGIRPPRARHHGGGLMTALRRLAADWRAQNWQRAIDEATTGLDARMLRDLGLRERAPTKRELVP